MALEIERRFLVSGQGWRPLVAWAEQLRQGYLSVVERCLIKEMEMAPNIEKAPHSMPKMTDVFIASLLLAVQRQTDNLFFFNDWIRHKVLPNFHRGLVRLRSRGMQAESADTADRRDIPLHFTAKQRRHANPKRKGTA
jgi:hypothetical protein